MALLCCICRGCRQPPTRQLPRLRVRDPLLLPHVVDPLHHASFHSCNASIRTDPCHAMAPIQSAPIVTVIGMPYAEQEEEVDGNDQEASVPRYEDVCTSAIPGVIVRGYPPRIEVAVEDMHMSD
jgi:hypothetical protein